MNVINQEITDQYAIYHADTVEVAKNIPDNSVGFSEGDILLSIPSNGGV